MNTATKTTPYHLVTSVAPVFEASKHALIAVTRGLEREALLDPPPAVGVTFQDVRYLTTETRRAYAAIAAKGVPVKLFGRGMQSWLAPGMQGISLEDDDLLVDEWSVVLPCREHPVVFVATDSVPGGADGAKPFTWSTSRDPDLVRACAELLDIPSR